MNYSDYRFTLDVQIHQSQVSVPVTFGDSARRLCIGLTDGRKPYTIEDGCRAVFNAKKPDGYTIKNDCIIERNVILYEFTEQTTNAEGVVNCDITIYDTDGKVLTSPQFIIVVDKRAVRDEEIPLSESESTTLDRIISSEDDRQATFEANESARQDAFNTAEAERKADFDNFYNELGIVQTIGNNEAAVMSQKATTDEFNKYFTVEKSINLFDKSQPRESGLLMSSGTIIAQSTEHATIPVVSGKTYTFPICFSWFGTAEAYNVTCFDTDLNRLNAVAGTPNANNTLLTFTIPTNLSTPIAFVKVNVASEYYQREQKYHIDNFMFVEGETYPSEYIPYKAPVIFLNPNVQVLADIPSPLYKKRVVFTGDSICHGLTDETGVRGWAQRIGEKNSMDWTNSAISGGTITSGLATSAGCIGDTDFGDSPDYIIIEGGVNDTTIGGKDANGNFPTAFGSYDIKNYGYTDFDKTTFCGAVEHLFRRVTTDYAGAKIGFIIAHKQGGWADGAYYGYNAENNKYRQYYETIIALCKKWGIPYIDLWEGCYLNPLNPSHNSGDNPFYYNGDMQHLTARGYDYITPMIEKWMETL